MDKLANGIRSASGVDLNHFSEYQSSEESPWRGLQDSAVKWAEFCIKELSPKEMKRGLKISAAIGAFVNTFGQDDA